MNNKKVFFLTFFIQNIQKLKMLGSRALNERANPYDHPCTENKWNPGAWYLQYCCAVCNEDKWFGWSGGMVGFISTKFNGTGRARLDFGNCHDNGRVIVKLDDQEISIASATSPGVPEDSKIIEFDYVDGTVLRIEEESGIIHFNSLTIIQCYSCSGDFYET